MNTDLVGVHPDYGGSWSFLVPSGADRLSECLEEFASVSERMLDACDGFLRPVEIEYSVKRFSDDGPASVAVSSEREGEPGFLDVDRRRLSDERGISAVPMRSHRTNNGEVVCVGDLEFVRSQTRIRLADGDAWLDRTSGRVKLVRFGEVLGGDPKEDPIHVSLTHLPLSQTVGVESGYHLLVETLSDIWFEETEVGQVNRRRLSAFFGRLVDAFELAEVRVDSRAHDEDTLRALVPD